MPFLHLRRLPKLVANNVRWQAQYILISLLPKRL